MWKSSILIFVLVSGRSSDAQVCLNNQRNPNQQGDTSTCVALGHYHIKTFDDYGVHFGSKCSFTLTTFKLGDGSEFKVDVGVNNNCGADNCPSVITISYNNKKYTLYIDDAQLATISSGGKSYPIPSVLDAASVLVNLRGDRIVVEFPKIGVTIKWNKRDMVEVTIDNKRNYQPLGLCGNNDKCSSNDQRLKNNEVTSDLSRFLREWQTDQGTCTDGIRTQSSCTLAERVQATLSCNELRSSRFQEAQQVLNPDPFVDGCIWSYCDCEKPDRTSCLCDTYEAYARAAINAGARKVDWRNGNGVKLCYPTCPGDLLYFPCEPMGGPQTCDSDIPAAGQNPEKCQEGCYCTANTFLFEDTCYIKRRCPCSCHGQIIKPGGTVEKKDKTCTCTDGKILCPKGDGTFTACGTGDPHFTTWDGRRYDFMGKCSYYLINANKFSIISDHYVYKNGVFIKEFSNAPSYIRHILIEMDGVLVELKPGPEAAVNNIPIKEFPFWAGSILITKTSSSTILVELPNWLDIEWNGVSNVFFRAPIDLQGKLRGLLGTFTEFRDDDFTLPDGTEVSDPNVFGNSWKTERSCRDEPLEPISHPCVTNPGVKSRAENICSVIKGDIFKPCEIEDIQGYYENCLYDACDCVDNPDLCACDQIAAMADICIRKGIKVDWRAKVPQCAVTCPAGQVYQECGDSCGRSCDDFSLRPFCETKCVEGCNCAPGTSLDEAGNCVAVEQCKCKLNGVRFPPGFQILKSTHELLTCQGGVWVLSLPTNREKNNVPTEEQLNKRCVLMEFSQYAGCKLAVPKTCENMHDYKAESVQQCEEGCECVNGYVLNTATGTCVKPEECPCFDNGRSYQEGSVIKRNDEQCVCKGGDWDCKVIVPECADGDVKVTDEGKCICKDNDWKCVAPQCIIWGDSHVKRFDGTRFDFQGKCSYIAAEASLNGNAFSIRLENEICSHTGATCLKSITVSTTIGQVTETVTLIKNGVLPNTDGYKKIKVTDWHQFAEVEIVDIGLKLFWDLNTWFSIRLDIDLWRQNAYGLCGKQDKEHHDIPVSTIDEILKFVDMWRLDNQCPKSEPNGDKCDDDRRNWAVSECEVLKGPLFSPCHSKVPVEDYYKVCVSDSCKCDIGGDCECFCTAVKAYAQRCNDFGIPIEWRSQKRCPVQCPDYIKHVPCMSVCPPRTCETRNHRRCEDQFCMEGCAPPPLSPGYVYLDDNYQIVVDERNCPPGGGTTETPGNTTVTPPEECDPTKCPTLKCPPDTIIMHIEGQCCDSCQHESKCVIVRENGDVILKEPGETWMEGFCKECTCVGKEKYKYCAQCKSKVCSNLGSADKITEDTYYELTRGTCCSKLEPTACVYKGKIYQPGEIWDVDECLSIQCILDPLTHQAIMLEISPICQQTCPVGFRYKKLHNACCGYCVQDSCVFEGKARRVGEEWTSDDGCLTYKCQIVKGQYQVYLFETDCPTIHHCSGNIRRGRCCEYCDTYEIFSWKNEPLRCSYVAA